MYPVNKRFTKWSDPSARLSVEKYEHKARYIVHYPQTRLRTS
jgi:hypothetical protein